MTIGAARTVLATVLFLSMLLGFADLQSSAGEAVTTVESKVPEEKNPEGQPRLVLPPEYEKKFAEFLEKVREARRRLLTARMKKEIEAIGNETGLNAGGTEALEAAARAPIEKCLDEWTGKLEERFRGTFPTEWVQLLTTLDGIVARVDSYVSRELGFAHAEPSDDPSWDEAVKRTLTTGQAAAWDKVLTERKNAQSKERDKYLKPMAGRINDYFKQTIFSKSASLSRRFSLSKERAEALNRIAEDAAKKGAEEWLKRAEKVVSSMEADQRLKVEMAQFWIILPSEWPEKQGIWKEGLLNLLTPEERQRRQTAKDEHHAKRVRALGQILLEEMDQKVAFTTPQRRRLLPIAGRLVNVPAYFPDDKGDYPSDFLTQVLFWAAAAAPENEMAEILDAGQWKRWKAACDLKNSGLDFLWPRVKPRLPPAWVEPPDSPPEPEELEIAVSEFMESRTIPTHRRMLAAMSLKAEDAARQTGLAPEACRRLQIAARGAAEASLAAWEGSIEHIVGERIEIADAQTARQRLSSIPEYEFENTTITPPEKQRVWSETVAVEMTLAQRAEWQKTMDERSEFKLRSIASLILAEFDGEIPISVEQWDKLQTIVLGIVKEYEPEFVNSSTNSNAGQWYLEWYTLFVPVAGVPEKDMASILTKEQFDQWKLSDECIYGTNRWSNIQEMHTQRLKEKK